MPAAKGGRRLPEFLSSLFWETDFSELRISENSEYIIERLIEYGDDRAITWLLSTFTREQIGSVVRASRRISPNTASLWAVVLNIPKETITCLSKPSLLPHTSFSKP